MSRKKVKEIYVSCDIESDGPIPGVYSMLSIGCVAFTEDGKIISTFEVNLETLPNAKQDPDTMEWWSRQPEAWRACRSNLTDPGEAMLELNNWLKNLPGKPVLTCYPSGFDHMFTYWYLVNFVGAKECAISFSGIDIKTYAMAIMKKPYTKCTKNRMPKSWFSKDYKHDHTALNDALGQYRLFYNMLKENTEDKLTFSDPSDEARFNRGVRDAENNIGQCETNEMYKKGWEFAKERMKGK